MKVFNVFLIMVIAALPSALSADSLWTERSVKYVGDSEARGICRAIVDDDTQVLERKLRLHKSHITGGYRFYTTGKAILGDFSCNDKELLTFANEIGANNVSNYLRGGRVTMEEYISSRD
jgi:hypothetical protein